MDASRFARSFRTGAILAGATILLGACGASGGTIHDAARNGDVGRINALLKEGVPVDKIDQRGYTALHAASANGQKAAAEALLNSGANIEAKTSIRSTPLWEACTNGHADVAAFLISRGADSTAGNVEGQTLLRQIEILDTNKIGRVNYSVVLEVLRKATNQ